MPKVAAKRKQGNGESEEEKISRRVRFPRSTVVAKLPVVSLVVTPEAASHARVDIIVDRNIASDVVVTDVVPIFKSYKRILRRVFRVYQEGYIVCRQEEGGEYQFLR